ncbi:MAG: GNAT family N-acetyltransferase [Ignavibacteriaceae bacterium]
MTYKLAVESDIPLLLEMTAEFYLIEHLPHNPQILTSALKKLFENPVYGKLWLILIDDEPAGYILVTFGYSLEYFGIDALVDEFYIREKFRGKGIGKQTLKYVEQELAGLGIKAFHLEVDRQNVYALEVYRKFGFADHDRYLMTKWISDPRDGAVE